SDTIQITGNTMAGPSSFGDTSGLELYSANTTITGNAISGYGDEGIGAHSLLNATISNNDVKDNGWKAKQVNRPTGGILVTTTFPPHACDYIPRDTGDPSLRPPGPSGIMIGNNASSAPLTTNQGYGVHLNTQKAFVTNRLYGVSVSGAVPTYSIAPAGIDRL